MTEHQTYDVLERRPGFELRHYPAHVVAEVEVRGSFEGAGNTAFRPLASYITRGGVAMTAPVLQHAVDEADDATTAGAYRVAFVMPAGASLASLPIPQDARVTIREVPEEQAAALAFSGRWTRASFRRHVADLQEAVTRDGLQPAGPVRWARFDPPWTPWFLRHNEVVLPVHRED